MNTLKRAIFTKSSKLVTHFSMNSAGMRSTSKLKWNQMCVTDNKILILIDYCTLMIVSFFLLSENIK